MLCSITNNLSEVYTGVPQGSILGPLFFSIDINDMITASDKLKFLMYVDDTTIYFNLEDFDSQNTEADINAELEKVKTWLKLNKLPLNAQKTKLMLFHRKQKDVNDVNVKIDNTVIESVETFNFFGIILQSLQKKAIRFMTNSSYIAHTAPLHIRHGLLLVHDMLKLKLLKFYYKLSYDLLPPYFITYSEIPTQIPSRELRHNYIHAPLVKRVYSECTSLL